MYRSLAKDHEKEGQNMTRVKNTGTGNDQQDFGEMQSTEILLKMKEQKNSGCATYDSSKLVGVAGAKECSIHHLRAPASTVVKRKGMMSRTIK
jgi:hypothetical protein